MAPALSTEPEARAWLESLPEFDRLASERITRFVAALREENLRQNLVSAASLAQVWQRHVADSVQLLRFAPRSASTPWLDIGTGAGFPGLVIAVLRPWMRVVLVESRPLRAEWLSRLVGDLGLGQTEVAAKSLAEVPSEPFAVISARAFAPLDQLLRLSARFSTSDTVFVLPKGRSAPDELQKLRGWQHMFHVEQSLTDPAAGIIVGNLFGRKGRVA